jgi:hypothetical protein
MPNALQACPPALRYANLESQVEELRARFREATPFPHLVLDDFVDPAVAGNAVVEFPAADAPEWLHYAHYNERKLAVTARARIPPTLGGIVDELNSSRFVGLLSRITGIPGLLPDPSLEGGGLHQIRRGGFLNIHADFTVHPHRPAWVRRLNLLLYLNREWRDSYGGQLEFWDRDVRTCMRRISPTFNRCVIFSTDPESFHGHPEPLTCPETMTRKSIALYYFVEEPGHRVRSTEYRARPNDGRLKATGIYADKMALRLYDRSKRALGLKDGGVGAVLRAIARLRGR